MGAVSSIGAGANALALERQRRERLRRVNETQSCDRGEHLYVTGKRYCPLCGADL